MRSMFTTLGLSVALLLVADAASLTRVPSLARQAAVAQDQYQFPEAAKLAEITGDRHLAELAKSGRRDSIVNHFAVSTYVYRVRARGHILKDGRWIPADPPPSCTAVSLGDGRFVTAGHLTEGLSGKVEVDVQVDGQWVNGVQQTRVPGRDLMYLKAATVDVPGVEARKPQYHEDVTIYGLKTERAQTGIYAGERHVALPPDEPGVDFGDSGGGVFGADGKLVGIIQGFGEDGRQSVFLVGIEEPTPSVAVTPKSVPQSGCPGGVCPRPMNLQPQGFAPRGRRR